MMEQYSLIGKAERYLSSARLLCDAGDYDSAISRIYYAAFYIAESLLDACGLAYSSHKGVISAFGKEFAQSGRMDAYFHRLLISAFEKRQQADYLADTGIDKEEVETLLGEANSFLAAAKSWLAKRT